MQKEIEFIVFWIVIILLILVSLFHDRLGKKTQRFCVCLFIILFSLMYAFRTLGMDFRNYDAFYNSITVDSLKNSIKISNILSNEYEPLFTILVYFLKVLGLTFNQAMLVMVLIPSYIFYYVIKKYTTYPLLMYLFFMIIMMFQFDLTRLFIALPFSFIALSSKKKHTKIIFYLLAIGLHYSVAFALLCDITHTMILKKKRYCVFLLAATTFMLLCLKYYDLSWAADSSIRILFKFQYYLKYNNIEYVNAFHQILSWTINFYPVLMCIYLIRIIESVKFEEIYVKELSEKIIKMLLVGLCVVVPFSIIFGSSQVSFRLLLVLYFPLFIPLSYICSKKIYSGKMKGRALSIFLALFLYDLLMTAYYIGVSVWA